MLGAIVISQMQQQDIAVKPSMNDAFHHMVLAKNSFMKSLKTVNFILSSSVTFCFFYTDCAVHQYAWRQKLSTTFMLAETILKLP